VGTNYYWKEDREPPCAHCGRTDPEVTLHIGKSSAGWVFSLHIDPEAGISDLPDWERVWANAAGHIEDEYGQRLSADDMRLVIMARAREERWGKKPFMYDSWEDFHRSNNSERGPVGLLRSKLDQRCIKHGDGTYDCFIGEFS
jgi:hypothetical protein